MRTGSFIYEAVPLIFLGVALINVFEFLGLADLLTKLAGPFVQHILGLPKETVAVIILGFLRKDISIALLNTTMMIWLYAALRPMFGVGVKTALITSLFVFVFVTAYIVNMANIFYYPWHIAFLEAFYLLAELPLSLIAGAYIYEGGWEQAQ